MGIGDLLAVAKLVDGNTLARELSVSPQELGQTTPLEGSHSLDAMTVLRVWRTRINNPAYNHRTVLADTMHRIGQPTLALDILSGTCVAEIILFQFFESLCILRAKLISYIKPCMFWG